MHARLQYVQYHGFRSKIIASPQGSNLGPLLFFLVVNDLPNIVSSTECVIFTDGIKIYRKITKMSHCNKLQKDLKKNSEWSKGLGLAFNTSKSNVVTYTRKRNIVG